jgi:voltage-gated potassium channel Kch
MEGGTGPLIGWLGLISLGIVLLFGAIISLTGITEDGGGHLGFIEASWQAMLRTLDSGNVANDNGWDIRIIFLIVTLAGIFVVSILIGVLTSGIEARLEELRKGRSNVLERDHTVILNWTPSIFDVIEQLVIANESRRAPRIVIMANRDMIEMQDEIASKISDLKNTKVICRSGDPADLYDLSIVNPYEARSIVILSPDGDDPDSSVIKTILALTQDPRRRPEKYHIAAEIRDSASAELARIVGGDEVQLILADNLISSIFVHSSRQPGLSAVYFELLDFDGSEIYITELPALVGKTVEEVISSFEDSVFIGIVDSEGKVTLNPPATQKIVTGDRLVVIAEDDSKISVKPFTGVIDTARIRQAPVPVKGPERTLMLGWNRRSPKIAAELARFVAPGSLLTVCADIEGLAEKLAEFDSANDHLTVEVVNKDSSSAEVLKSLNVSSYDHVLVLGYVETMAPQPADTRTLVTLLHLRRIADQTGYAASVVSEMIDIRNRELAEVSRADDFVVSNKLVSLMLSQAAENEYLSDILGNLLEKDGCEVYLHPAASYVETGVPVDFYTVSKAAIDRGEIAIGYRKKGADNNDPRNLGGVRINPVKAEKLVYTPEDCIVVIAAE